MYLIAKVAAVSSAAEHKDFISADGDLAVAVCVVGQARHGDLAEDDPVQRRLREAMGGREAPGEDKTQVGMKRAEAGVEPLVGRPTGLVPVVESAVVGEALIRVILLVAVIPSAHHRDVIYVLGACSILGPLRIMFSSALFRTLSQ